MELQGRRPRFADPDVGGQHRVEGIPKSHCAPLRGHRDSRDLTRRMDAPVGSARTRHRAGRAGEPPDGGLQLPLDRALLPLCLPAEKGAAVVVEREGEASLLGRHVRNVQVGKKGFKRPRHGDLPAAAGGRSLARMDAPVSNAREGPDRLRIHFPTLLTKVTEGEDLGSREAEAAFDLFMDGSATPVQMAALLIGMKAKGLAASEVAGGVRALRRAMVPVPASEPDLLVDTAGTGGGDVTTFNISTAGALVAAGAGVKIAKHGNRSFTSRCGSADVLEALGVNIGLAPERMGEILEEIGIVFMFAPLLHPAMRHVGPVRKELGISTVMNVLGPLTNPAGARRQVVGVADPNLVSLVVRALRELGHIRSLVVHGTPGMDEISPAGLTRMAELSGGEVAEREITPELLGLDARPLEGIAGGDCAYNAQVIRDVLADKRQDAARTATLLNAAAAIYVGGAAESLARGVTMACEAISSGAALRRLEALMEASAR